MEQMPGTCLVQLACAVDDRGAPLAILLADPQGSQDGATNPEWVLTLRESDALALHCVGC